MEDKYLIDANIFITAHRQLYPFDIFISFWEKLVEKAADQMVIIEQIEEEILRGKDKLSEWYTKEKSEFTVLVIPDQIVQESYREIINFVEDSENYIQSAKDEFASVADSWLCAYCNP